jgi:very-short-patch-repair endonuclease
MVWDREARPANQVEIFLFSRPHPNPPPLGEGTCRSLAFSLKFGIFQALDNDGLKLSLENWLCYSLPQRGRVRVGAIKMNSGQLARNLRKNMTDAERVLWQHLRRKQIRSFKFRRQCPIGPYIVDFVCFDKMLVIELDGGQHAVAQEADGRRTEWLNRQGYRVLRFWNHEVLQQPEAVLEVIWKVLINASSLPLMQRNTLF